MDEFVRPEHSPDMDLQRAREQVRGRLFDVVPTMPRIGRFELLEKLGQGAMGQVFAARDQELHREVAVKLLHSDEPLQAQRLLREARALARLSHPNVVTIYEAGTAADQVYLAMEFVSGQDMRRWLAQRRRSWREILPVLIDAARGLVAAHRAGLVHRDFKPENVLVGDDGRAKVADFGLARAAASVDVTDGEIDRSDPSVVSTLTRTGAIAGTPAYLPPEVFDGNVPDARGDQFSFCVAAYEALCGHRPFAGDTLMRIHDNVVAGRIQAPLPGARVPTALRRLIVRGLSPRPEQRHPSMDVLLRGFEGVLHRRRRRATVAGVGLFAAAVAAALWRPDPAELCTGAGAAWSDAWSDARQQELASIMGTSTYPGALDTVERVSAALDAYGQRWTELHHGLCVATHGRGEQSQELLDAQLACLDQRKVHVKALVASLITAEPGIIQRAVSAVGRLPELDSCRDGPDVEAQLNQPQDPAISAQVQTLRQGLAEAEALERLGDQGSAEQRYKVLEDDADALGYRPLVIDVRLSRASGAAQTPETRDLLYRALYDAETIGDLDAQRVAWTALVAVHAYLDEPEASRRAAQHAAAFVERRGDLPEHRAKLVANIAFSHLERSEFTEAVAAIENALSLLPDDDEHRLDRSELLVSLGTIYTLAERNDDALLAYEQAYASQLTLLGSEHETVATTMFHLGRVASRLDRLDESNDWYERALATFARVGAEDSMPAIMALNNLGQNYGDQGRYADAITTVQRALTATLAKVGPDHRYLVRLRRGLSEIYLQAGDHTKAISECEEALRVSEATFGDTHDETASTRRRLGEILLAAGQVGRARGLLERALEDHLRPGVPPVHVAVSQYWLFRALMNDPREQGRAQALARAAVPALAAGEPRLASKVEELQAWLRDQAD